jgi:(p)ppGpp synthase/HD superfamily hydrolase
MNDSTYIKKAADFARKAHEGQKRKDGKDYFTHVEAVAQIVQDNWLAQGANAIWNDFKDDVVAAAYLHDVIEDCGVTKQGLIDEGFSQQTAGLVEVLSKKEGENYFDFIMRINKDRLRFGVVAVKLADLQHNMSDLNEGSLKDKYRFAYYILSNTDK